MKRSPLRFVFTKLGSPPNILVERKQLKPKKTTPPPIQGRVFLQANGKEIINHNLYHVQETIRCIQQQKI